MDDIQAEEDDGDDSDDDLTIMVATLSTHLISIYCCIYV